jgi:Ca-activated chloride channel family protein
MGAGCGTGTVCGGGGGGGGGCGSGGGVGATPGGAQDMSFIRAQIQSGAIPQPGNFYVEGIFSEYDLPINGEPAKTTFCIRTASGFSADAGIPDPGIYVQLGFSSNVDPATFHRNPLNLSVVVDRSGSMAGEKLEGVKVAVGRLVDQLGETDVFSLVQFDHTMQVLVNPAPVSDKAAIQKIISSICSGGSTNMDIGLRKGYELVKGNLGCGKSPRVMLFTDAMPNTGDFSTANFISIVGVGAADGIGLTAFGVGLDFDQQLINYIATQRGGNYFYLQNREKIETVFDLDFDYMVTPIAYDLKAVIEPLGDLKIASAYGFPGSNSSTLSMEIATIFLARGRGAVLFRLETPENSDIILKGGDRLMSVNLSYEGTDGVIYTEEMKEVYAGPDIRSKRDQYFEQDGTRLTTALAREVVALKAACALYYEGKKDEAQAILDALLSFLTSEKTDMGVDEMQQELDLVVKLKENMAK